MTQRDPKDMTASELLRWAAMYSTDKHGVLSPAFKLLSALSKKSCGDMTLEDDASAFRLLADKIDAELAEAGRVSVLGHLDLVVAAYGWPKRKSGEFMSDYIDRCWLPIPRFEDGEPVQLGDETAWGTVSEIRVYAGGEWEMCFEEADCYGEDGNRDERVERPAPEVLLADGKPAKVGETVWHEDGTELRVTAVTDDCQDGERMIAVKRLSGPTDWGIVRSLSVTHTPPVMAADGKPLREGDTVWLTDEGAKHAGGFLAAGGADDHSMRYIGPNDRLTVSRETEEFHEKMPGDIFFRNQRGELGWCHASWLTHEEPDTLAKIEEDASMPPAAYCAMRGIDLGGDPDRETATAAMVRDLLARQRAVLARGGDR